MHIGHARFFSLFLSDGDHQPFITYQVQVQGVEQ